MPKVRKRKVPIVPAIASNSSSKAQSTRTVIRQFHVLLKQRTKLQNELPRTLENTKHLAQIEHEISELGGLECYQRMSAVGQGEDRGGGSEKVLIAWMKESGLASNPTEKLKLLEVGALLPDNYKSCSRWIESTPIDLRSRHPAIMEQDFLMMTDIQHREKWNIISLSLVLNFVPDAKDRGRMLRLAHSMLAPGGFIFLVLPLPCVTNSRYLTFPQLHALMRCIGFTELQCKWRKGGKIAYWLYQKQDNALSSLLPVDPFLKKTVVRTGHRNNFSILLAD